MVFYSTSDRNFHASLRKAALEGLAPGGGLYLPCELPGIPAAFFNNITAMSISDIAYVIASILMGDEIDSAELKRIVADTFDFDIPLVRVEKNIYSLELSHGPTKSFKDIGVRFLVNILKEFSKSDSKHVNVIAATSGSSCETIVNAFNGVSGIDVFIVYPSGQLDKRQRESLVTAGKNVHPVEVNGTFDNCQTLVRQALTDSDLRKEKYLTSANTVNIMRLIPQTFYFFHAYARLIAADVNPDEIVCSIPCGNLGNLAAAIMAKGMNLPVKRLIAANNENNAFVRYVNNGESGWKQTFKTLAPSMDVENPSNLPRIKDLLAKSVVTSGFSAVTVPDSDIRGTVLDTLCSDSYMLDPHGATAFRALKENLLESETGFFLSPAHPSKFAAQIFDITGIELDSFKQKQHAQLPPLRPVRIPPLYPALKDYLKDYCH